MAKKDTKEDDKESLVIRSKTDQRYWLNRLKKRSRSVNGTRVTDPNFSVQISFDKRKERVNLATANKSDAAARAAAFYRSLVADGWECAYEVHTFARTGRRGLSKAGAVQQNETLGALFAAYEKVAAPRTSTMSSYKKALRKIYSEIAGITADKRAPSAPSRNRAWRDQVDNLPLNTLTADTLQDWKYAKLGRIDLTLDERRAHTVTLNSLLRNGRSIFAKKHRAALAKHVLLPEPIPFDDVRLESSPTPRYRSRINARAILKSADSELRETHPILYATLNLALRTGLRRKEIDTLMWKSLDLDRKVVHVEANEYYDLKSTDSAGEVDINDDFLGFLRQYRKKHSTGIFLIPTPPKIRKRQASTNNTEWSAASQGYRCKTVFEDLTKWLRAHGVDSKRPIHELRKEIGSLVANEHGIYAASRFMRHADIRITAASYLDKKKRIVAPI